MNEITLTPAQIEAAEIAKIKDPIVGEDGITRYDARTKPHYWIYKEGVEVWNKWGENNLTNEEKITITANIKKYCLLFAEESNNTYPHDPIIIPLPDELIDFADTIWYAFTYFNNAIFAEYADFSNATFTQHTNFNNTAFTEYVEFRRTIFTQDVTFRHATFTQDTDFRNATFTQNAYFRNAAFTECVDFSDATFIQEAHFGNVTFSQYPDFSNATFSNNVFFHNAIFEKYAPNLLGITIRDYINFSAKETHFPKYNPKIRCAESTATNYSILKSLMKNMEFADKELFFHGKELEAKSYDDKNEDKHLRLLYKYYGLLSNYGQSVLLPLKGLGATMIIWFFLYFIHAMFFSSFPSTNDVYFSHSIYSTIHYSLPFLPSDMSFHKLAFELKDICTISKNHYKPYCIGTFGFLKGAQSIVSLFWLFLIGLGLRNNLRMR